MKKPNRPTFKTKMKAKKALDKIVLIEDKKNFLSEEIELKKKLTTNENIKYAFGRLPSRTPKKK